MSSPTDQLPDTTSGDGYACNVKGTDGQWHRVADFEWLRAVMSGDSDYKTMCNAVVTQALPGADADECPLCALVVDRLDLADPLRLSEGGTSRAERFVADLKSEGLRPTCP